MHMIEVATIYNVPAKTTDLTYLKLASLPMPFHSANGDEGCRSGYFVKSRGTITNLHYSSFCGAWSFSPWCRAVADLTLLKVACLSLMPWMLTGGLLSQRANLLSWFLSITSVIICDFYLSGKSC